jgi:hypothetical protein
MNLGNKKSILFTIVPVIIVISAILTVLYFGVVIALGIEVFIHPDSVVAKLGELFKIFKESAGL